MGDSNAQRQDRHFHQCNGQATIVTIEIPRSTRSTLLLLVRSSFFEALPDCALSACDAMCLYNLYLHTKVIFKSSEADAKTCFSQELVPI